MPDKKNAQKNTSKKCGFISIIGAPNAGKSTLINSFTGQKISIVTPKAQTTRNRIRGIRIYEDTQMIFVDTPGIFRIKGRLDNQLNRSIVQMAKTSFEGTDFIILLIDAQKDITEDDREVIELLKNEKTKKLLVLNKVDIIDKSRLLELSQKLNELLQFETVFMISALKGKGVEDILRYLAKELPEGPYLYPEDEISDFPARLMAADVTRERLFINLHDEIPYNTMVETETYKEDARGIRINQSIYVISETHKKMLIGTKGSVIKKVGEESRRQLTKMLGKKVHLFLHVKVRDKWMENKENYHISGLEFFS